MSLILTAETDARHVEIYMHDALHRTATKSNATTLLLTGQQWRQSSHRSGVALAEQDGHHRAVAAQRHFSNDCGPAFTHIRSEP